MTEWPPELGAQTVIFHTVQARLLRAEARTITVKSLASAIARAMRYAFAVTSSTTL